MSTSEQCVCLRVAGAEAHDDVDDPHPGLAGAPSMSLPAGNQPAELTRRAIPQVCLRPWCTTPRASHSAEAPRVSAPSPASHNLAARRGSLRCRLFPPWDLVEVTRRAHQNTPWRDGARFVPREWPARTAAPSHAVGRRTSRCCQRPSPPGPRCAPGSGRAGPRPSGWPASRDRTRPHTRQVRPGTRYPRDDGGAMSDEQRSRAHGRRASRPHDRDPRRPTDVRGSTRWSCRRAMRCRSAAVRVSRCTRRCSRSRCTGRPRRRP